MLDGPATCEDDPTYGWRCVASTIGRCPPCPGGTRCDGEGGDALCDWGRHRGGAPCTVDGDCVEPLGGGLSCAEGPAGRTCETRCRGDHTCPYAECEPAMTLRPGMPF